MHKPLLKPALAPAITTEDGVRTLSEEELRQVVGGDGDMGDSSGRTSFRSLNDKLARD